ncbi:hypothetical protein [Chitinibacter tainanensis]|uniref:hypothetical protein n=1 Tax=Chitinibacter tainanensis TaxID=230667 RepID=UPI0023526A84|nr:hypothetical protein [Chitinibacter tainanensis]
MRQAHLIAPSSLIPLIASRLHWQTPRQTAFCLHPLSQQLPSIATDEAILLFHPGSPYLQQHYPEHPLCEVIIVPSPLAGLHGFMLAASGEHAALEQSAEILDLLAPVANGWLHLGPRGCGGFIQQIWQTLLPPSQSAEQQDWQAILSTLQQPNPFQQQGPLLTALSHQLLQQQLQLSTLRGLAHRFLQDFPPAAFHAHHPQLEQAFAPLISNEYSPTHQLAQLLSQQ